MHTEHLLLCNDPGLASLWAIIRVYIKKREPETAGCLRRDGGRPLRCASSCHPWGKAVETLEM